MFYIFPLLPLLFKNNRYRFLLLVSFFFLVLLAGYRVDSVGTDTYTYLSYFNQIKYFGSLNIEPLWLLLNKLVVWMNGDFYGVKILASFLTLLPLYLIFRKLDYPFFALFIYLSFYYYFYSYNIMRQCLAMSWAFYGVYVLQEENREQGWIWFLFAWGFHITAIIIPFFYYIRHIFYGRKKRIYLTLAFSIIVGIIMGKYFIGIAKSIFPNYTDLNVAPKTLLSAFIDLIILNSAFYIINEALVKKDFTIWSYFFFVFILLTNLMVLLPFGNRFIFYAGVMLPVFFTELISKSKVTKGYSALIVLLIIGYSYFRYIRLLGGGGIEPYINSLFNIEINL